MSNDEIKDLFETLGVTRRYIGYYFLLDAVEIVNRDETTLLKAHSQKVQLQHRNR